MSAYPPGPSPRRWLLLAPIVVGTCLLLTAVVLILILLVRGSLPGVSEPTPTVPVEIESSPSPTPPESAATPVPPPRCETIISSGDTELPVPLPISLTVDSAVFPVKALVPEAQGWTYPADYSGAAAWVCGTVVNYVMVLEPTPENTALLESMKPGDEVTLRLSNGTDLLFRFTERREVAAQEPSVLEQRRPRSTLIVAGETGTWQVATADYVAEAEATQLPSGRLAKLNETVLVGDVQVTVTKWHVKRNQPNQQPGTMFYLVEFSVENVGTEPLDADLISMQLQDSAGNWYLLSPSATAAGENGPLSGNIAPGTTAQGTAGYIVPEMLAGPNLIWTFTPRPGMEEQVSVSIPYQGEARPPGAIDQIEVSITDAFLSSDGTTLVIEGELHNTGDEAFSVELNNVSLTSSAGIGELRMAAPPLPWTVAPGQRQVIELQYAKPDAPAALLTLLGYTFEIQGLK